MSTSLQLSIPDLKLLDHECEAYGAEEGLSRPFRLEAFFTSMSAFTGAQAVGKPAWFRVKRNTGERTIGGVVLEFRLLNKIDVNSYTYAVVIGPRLALLDRTRQSAVFAPDGEMGVRDLLDGLLSGSLYDGATVGDRGVTLDYEILDSVENKFKRTNITKYNESDFQFFSRVCEHYGIFYFFESFTASGMVKDRLVVAANNAAFPASGTGPWAFKPATTTVSVTETAVTSLEWVARPPLKQFRLRDFSEDKPDTDMLVASHASQSGGIGEVVEYGDHYLTREEGEALVEIRAQEEAWQASVFQCESTVCTLSAGQVFTLKGYPIAALNTDYVVIEARHEAGKRGPLGYAANYQDVPYHNRFTAIRKSQAFRPRRVTPRPTMAGVFNAVVEADDTGATRAALDSSGRYRVGLGYNEAAGRNTAGKGSGPVRQAQPYAGSSADSVVSGMHFPLVRNTEVLVGYVNGDPDRPVILGAAFNQNNVDPVTSTSNTVNRLRTTGGLLMELDDGGDSSAARYVRFDVPKAVTDAPPSSAEGAEPSGTYLRLGDAASDSCAQSGLTYSTSTVSQEKQDNKNESGDDWYTEDSSSSKTAKKKSAVAATDHTPSGKGILLYSDDDLDINLKGAGLMQFGAGHTTRTVEGDSRHTVDKGQYTLTTKNGVTIEAGTSDSKADIVIHATNTVKTTSDGDTHDWTYGKSTKFTKGESITIFLGFEETVKAATSLTLFLGIKMEMVAGIKVDLPLQAVKIVGEDVKIAHTDYKIATKDSKYIVDATHTYLAGMKEISTIRGVKALGNTIDAGWEMAKTGTSNLIASIRSRKDSTSSSIVGTESMVSTDRVSIV